MNGFKPTSIVVDGPICIGNWCPQNYSGGYAGSMTLTEALTRSINTIPVQAVDRARQRQRQGRPRQDRRSSPSAMGLRTPLPDTPSLPIGADEVTVLDHTAAYADLPQRRHGGHAARASSRCAPAPARWSGASTATARSRAQVLPPQVALDMNMMMNKVAEEGTGRRALLDGMRIAGKTGTTNAYRDAWFVGYTGNMVGGVWFGNDDYSSTNRMTGGSLPAMTWHEIMAYAHQGIELKTDPRRRAEPAADRAARSPGRRGRHRPRAAPIAPDRADPARHRRAGPDRAPDGRRRPQQLGRRRRRPAVASLRRDRPRRWHERSDALRVGRAGEPGSRHGARATRRVEHAHQLDRSQSDS